jgi:hypothetical protein
MLDVSGAKDVEKTHKNRKVRVGYSRKVQNKRGFCDFLFSAALYPCSLMTSDSPLLPNPKSTSLLSKAGLINHLLGFLVVKERQMSRNTQSK